MNQIAGRLLACAYVVNHVAQTCATKCQVLACPCFHAIAVMRMPVTACAGRIVRRIIATSRFQKRSFRSLLTKTMVRARVNDAGASLSVD